MRQKMITIGLLIISMNLYAQPVFNKVDNAALALTETATEIDGKPLFSIKASKEVSAKDDNTEAEDKEIKVVKVIDFTQEPPKVAVLVDSDANKAINSSRSLKRATSYTVHGKTYRTLAESEGFIQEGSASWYGPGFHGRKTASGEIFDMNALTAAHKELPLGTKVEVTNLTTGKSVVVRINDRGPFHGNRVLDLSRAAAKEIGVIKRGTANVSIRALQ